MLRHGTPGSMRSLRFCTREVEVWKRSADFDERFSYATFLLMDHNDKTFTYNTQKTDITK